MPRILLSLLFGLLLSFNAHSQTNSKENTMGVNLVISFKVREDKIASFNDLMKTVKASLPGVPGCRGVRIYRDVDNPLVFTLVETWDSAEAHAKHVQGLRDSGQWATIAQMLSADPVSSYYQEL